MIQLKLNEAIDLSISKMLRNGVPEPEAEIAAPIFLEAELWGKHEHGFRYLETCLLEYRAASSRRRAVSIQRETPLRALVDGGFHFSCFVHHTAMQLAIDKAQTNDLALVGVRNGGVSGLLGYYSQMATEAGLIGIGINSALSVVVPPGGVTPLLSTNPLTIGIPRTDRAPLILDMATSAGTFSQVLMAQRDHTALPTGIAVDPEGHPTIDPFKAVDEANRPHLLPFGGYKGFGIELMIELLCDACLGTPSGKSKLMAGLDPTVDNGLYLVLRPDLFVERGVFDAQVSQLIADLHDSSKVAGSSEMRLPGEESQHRKVALLRTGTIEIEELLYEFLQAP